MCFGVSTEYYSCHTLYHTHTEVTKIQNKCSSHTPVNTFILPFLSSYYIYWHFPLLLFHLNLFFLRFSTLCFLSYVSFLKCIVFFLVTLSPFSSPIPGLRYVFSIRVTQGLSLRCNLHWPTVQTCTCFVDSLLISYKNHCWQYVLIQYYR